MSGRKQWNKQAATSSFLDKKTPQSLIQQGLEGSTVVGKFQNVFLSEGELASLQSDFPNRYVEYIDRLSVYMASNGRHYANHYATLRKWLNEDIRSGNTKTYTAEDYGEGECL